jgi:Family of unknown function (DUF5522)
MNFAPEAALRENSAMDAYPPSGHSPLSPEDYYMEGQYMVFTAAYHLKRGYCCGSGCRHCPYKESPSTGEKTPNVE